MEREIKATQDYCGQPPKWYQVRMSTWWWLGRWPFLKFILRELSSIFIAWFVVVVLLQLRSLTHGPEAYTQFQSWLKHPLLIMVNAIGFCFVLFHTITWFNLSPRAMAVRVRGKRVPDLFIAGPNYLVWLIISAATAWLILGK